ncbi:MAG TPA: hypothetical protein VMD91_09695 [Candidatus Sulfotelmatobacter sp.]|nr:hypothetical protein [Candidatus Sulfotelmatobacter sp.]
MFGSRRRWAARAACALVALLSACDGGGSTNVLPTPTAPLQATRVVVTLDAPAPATAAANRRAPKYISAETASIVYTVTNSSGTVVSGGQGYVNLGTSPYGYCTQSGVAAPLVCTDSLSLELSSSGPYTFAVGAYDQPQTANCVPGSATACAGHALSQTIVQQTLTVGSANTVSLTLIGLPATISVALAPGQSSVRTSAQGEQFVFGATRFVLTALDADGNVIVGPGAPSFSVSTTNGTVSQPTTAQPNLATVTASTTGAMTVSASTQLATAAGTSCGPSGATCSGSLTVNAVAATLIAVGYETGNVVDVFQDGGSAPVRLAAMQLSQQPDFVTFCADGTLVAAGPSQQLTFAAPPYTSTSSLTVPGTGNIAGLACRQGTLYVAAGSSIYEFASPLTGASTPTTTLALGSYTASPTFSPLDPSSFMNGALAVAPNGTVYAIGSGAGGLWLLSPGQPPIASIASTTGGNSDALTTDAAGDLFMTNPDYDTVTEIPAGGTSSTTVSVPVTPFGGIAYAGALYFGTGTNGALDALTIPLTAGETVTTGASLVPPGSAQNTAVASTDAVDWNGNVVVATEASYPGVYSPNPHYEASEVDVSNWTIPYQPYDDSTNLGNVVTSVATFP